MPNPAVDRAFDLLAAGRVQEAAALADQILARTPAEPGAAYVKGSALSAANAHGEAIGWLEAACKGEPDEPAFFNALGTAYLGVERIDDAERTYRHALSLNPRDAAIQMNVGVALQRRAEMTAAIDCYRRAIKLNPGYIQAYLNLTAACAAQGDSEGAFATARTVYARASDLPPVASNYGYALLARGKLEEAEQVFLKIADQNPGFPNAWFNLSQLRRFGTDDPVFARFVRMEREIERQPPPAQAIMRHALGRVFDQVGDYDRAFAHYSAGARIKRKLSPYDERDLFRQVDFARRLFTPELLKRSADNPPCASELPILVVGMPRSGTTLVEHILASHAEVHGAGELWFGERIARELLPREDLWRGPEEALDRVLASAGERYVADCKVLAPPSAVRVTDKRPDNFIYLGMFAAMLPRASVLHCARDAMDICVSAYFTLFDNGARWSNDLAELGRFYRLYAQLMEHWRATLPRAPLDVSYEDLTDDFEPTVRRMLEHCGLPFDAKCLRFHETERTVRTPSSTQVRQPIYKSSRQRWRNYEKHLGPLIDALGPLAHSKA